MTSREQDQLNLLLTDKTPSQAVSSDGQTDKRALLRSACLSVSQKADDQKLTTTPAERSWLISGGVRFSTLRDENGRRLELGFMRNPVQAALDVLEDFGALTGATAGLEKVLPQIAAAMADHFESLGLLRPWHPVRVWHEEVAAVVAEARRLHGCET